MLMKVGPRILCSALNGPEAPDGSRAGASRGARCARWWTSTRRCPWAGSRRRCRPAPEVLPMRCLRCQGPVERGTAPVCLEGQGYRLAWEQVPAWVCTRCELAYFEPEEVETVRAGAAGHAGA